MFSADSPVLYEFYYVLISQEPPVISVDRYQDTINVSAAVLLIDHERSAKRRVIYVDLTIWLRRGGPFLLRGILIDSCQRDVPFREPVHSRLEKVFSLAVTASHRVQDKLMTIPDKAFQYRHRTDIGSDGRVAMLYHRAVEVQYDIVTAVSHLLKFDVLAARE